MQPGLLTPSLPAQTSDARLYSPRSSFFVAFFGGQIAQILYSAVNSYCLKRKADIAAYLAGMSLAVGLVYWQVAGGDSAAMQWMKDQFGERATDRYLPRILALTLWGAFYLMHRKYHRSREMFDRPIPNPWVPAMFCGAAGVGVNYMVAVLLKQGLGG